ncbi:hypothetical protein TSUD_382080 [Trifolium subterraneum]|uniref:Uncharacterized protein n=1 Tax=Trifolium subterraneum TaxID=3900 RepID=A0A2Z6NP91_TRISU|nr:hypothetical protein TSUD_382080 [Trifolium subterraneum]
MGGGNLMDSAANFTNGHGISDNEGRETSNVIIGYVQICVLLRTQALASLHCGLQNNQGLPVANWLAMEDEDIEGLLEYHGFLIKAFGEPYTVKEGLFLSAVLNTPQSVPNLCTRKVGDTLGRRNPDAKCLCWKILLCTQMSSAHEMGTAGLWLTSKLMPSSNDDVMISSPGLVIWRKWVPSQSDIDPTCYHTTVGSRDEIVSGESEILFLVSESISWNHQRVHLHNLLMSIPSGACLPLLILCDSYDSSSVIINELGLQDIDKLCLSGFLRVFLRENQQRKHMNGFFSDARLREGMQWLAAKSPLQPNLMQEIENQRTQFESFLIQYLTRTSNTMGVSFAAKEACVIIIQRCAKLELCGTSYRVVPHWECHHNVALQNVGTEACLSPSYLYSDISFDEMISLSCDFPLLANDERPRPEALHCLPQINFEGC